MDTANDKRIICKVCVRQYAKYICPRCNTAYCGLPCYKLHSERCTESFYREQTVSELQGARAGDEQRRRMVDILQRAHEQQAVDEQLYGTLLAPGEDDDEQDGAAAAPEDGAGLVDAVRGLGIGGGGEAMADSDRGSESGGEGEQGQGDDEDDDDDDDDDAGAAGPRLGALASVLSAATLERLMDKALTHGSDFEVAEEDLTPEEWKAFQRAVALGQLSHLVEPWQPWWTLPEAKELQLSATGQPRIQPLDGSSSNSSSTAAAGGPGAGSQTLQPPVTTTCTTGRDNASGPSLGQRRRGGGESQASTALPAAPSEPLPPLSSLTRTAPSQLLRWHLVEVLYAYCFVLRLYNGDWADDAGAAAATLLCLTDVLGVAAAAAAAAGPRRPAAAAAPSLAPPGSQRAQSDSASRPGGGAGAAAAAGRGAAAVAHAAAELPQSASEACQHCVERACAPPVGEAQGAARGVAILYDVVSLLDNGRPSVLLALTDARRIVMQAAAASPDPSAEPAAPESSSGPGGPSASSSAQQHRGRGHIGSSKTGGSSNGLGSHAKRGVAPQLALSKAQRAQLAGAERKLWFFKVWANEQDEAVLEAATAAVMQEWQQRHEAIVTSQAPQRSRT